MIRYNKLAKVSAVETIQNELVVSKWDEESFHFGPRKSAWHCESPVEKAPAMNPHIVELGVFAHVNEGLLKVLGVAVDPLALVATLGDGIELFRTEVTRESHALDKAL